MEDSRSDNHRPDDPGDKGWITPPPEGWGEGSAEGREEEGHPYLSSQSDAAVAVEKPKKYSVGKAFRDIIIPLVIAFAVAMFVQATVAKPYKIPSGSMLPTIRLGDRVLANRVIYHFQDIQRGDVVVFEPPNGGMADPGVPFIKRVVGLPGDTVEVVNGRTLVNGEEFDVPEADAPAYTRQLEVVPEGQLFVLGDNRNQSSDSHIWGYVPIENLIGRVEVIYWPPGHMTRM